MRSHWYVFVRRRRGKIVEAWVQAWVDRSQRAEAWSHHYTLAGAERSLKKLGIDLDLVDVKEEP